MRDLVSGAAVTKTGLAASSAVTISGGQLLPLFGTGNYADLQQPARITSGTQPVTIAWVQEPRSPSAYNALLNWKISGAANSFAIYQATADAGYYFAIGPRSGGSVQLLYASIGATTNGALDVFVLVCRGGLNSTTASDYTLYRNGVVIASSGTTNFGANSASVFRVGALDSGGDPFEGAIGDLHVWSRGLNDAEARSWTQNRFQTLKPAANRSVFLATVGSGADFSYSATGGIAFGGSAGAEEANAYQQAGSGGITFSGAAAAEATSSFSIAGAGGIQLGGEATASVSGGFDFIGSGGLALAGAAGAAFTAAHIAAGAGGIVFAGAAAASVNAGNEAVATGGITFGGSAGAESEGVYSSRGGGGGVEAAKRRWQQERAEEEEMIMVLTALASVGVFE